MDDVSIEEWKTKRLIRNLEGARGNGTSMISLIIRPREEISRTAKKLTDELGTAQNIRARVNRQSVISAISSAQQRLKQYNRTPTNGLVIYCGTVLTDDGKEKKLTIDFEPFKPVNTSLYLCDNKFHVEALRELLDADKKFGFIVMDGNGALFGTLEGNTREVLHRFTVDLPKKHGRGGQSAVRFARLRTEKRHNYVRKVAETAVQMFITADKPNVAGLILAGIADFKKDLAQSDLLDNRLQNHILKTVDVSYGGDNGFNQAIELAADALANVKFVQEKKIICKFFDEVAQDTGKFIFGIEDTLNALKDGAVEMLILWEALEIQRVVLRHPTQSERVLFLRPEQDHSDERLFKDEDTGLDLDIVESELLTEWVVNNYKKFGASLELVTNKSQEGSQYQKGFGGFGGILRYKVGFQDYEEVADDDEDTFI
eukprot:GHVU01004409.1.p1 GENE.GHVU01004409.1~~GHVU01004409.1.p1  ORF type:complete len:429 (-),score=125.70 GHVU01004409.1:478-1764(-)